MFKKKKKSFLFVVIDYENWWPRNGKSEGRRDNTKHDPYKR